MRHCKYLLPLFLCATFIQAAEPEAPGKGGDEVPCLHSIGLIIPIPRHIYF